MDGLKTVAKIAAAAAGGVIVGDMIAARVEKVEAVGKFSPENRRALRIGIQAGTAALGFGLINAVL